MAEISNSVTGNKPDIRICNTIVVGEPLAGKTRLVSEMLACAMAQPDLSQAERQYTDEEKSQLAEEFRKNFPICCPLAEHGDGDHDQ